MSELEKIRDGIYDHRSVTTGSWVEDWPKYENGQYFCNCIYCKGTFIGHPGRSVCKTCHTQLTFKIELVK